MSTQAAAASRVCLRRWTVSPTRHSLTIVHRQFSSNMGFSPMSPGTPLQTFSGSTIPGEMDARIGGVWSATSAKRDKLGELRGELVVGQLSLDDAATPEQLLDLYLADGMHVIAKASDTLEATSSTILMDLQEWMAEQVNDKDLLTQSHWEGFLTNVDQEIQSILLGLPKTLYLQDIRDILEPKEITAEDGDLSAYGSELREGTVEQCVIRYRLALLQETVTQLKKAWNELTKVSDADLDRAATQGVSLLPQATTLRKDKLLDVLNSFATGTCRTRTDALWNLLDRDGDGLLDQVEMERVCKLSITPVQASVRRLLEEAITARPVRAPLSIGDNQEAKPPTGWRARRKEQKVKKRLLKLFQETLNKHFEEEIEMPQRLRCIYAWAEKAHQCNKIDNVMIDTGLGGRKRYVELAPKISLLEFREVQTIHFTQLDTVGEELIKSFREHLHVDQGKGRQRKELYQQGAAFFTAVLIVDMVIGYL